MRNAKCRLRAAEAGLSPNSFVFRIRVFTVPANAFFSRASVSLGPTILFVGILSLRFSAAMAAHSSFRSLPTEYGYPVGGDKIPTKRMVGPRLTLVREKKALAGMVKTLIRKTKKCSTRNPDYGVLNCLPWNGYTSHAAWNTRVSTLRTHIPNASTIHGTCPL